MTADRILHEQGDTTPPYVCRCDTLPADFTVAPLDHARRCPAYGTAAQR